MNYDSLLNIINGIIKNEEKFEESPNEIYSLFKKHGYERDIETLKLDLKNLLNDVIKSDEELSKVAGGKVSKLAAGAVAALTCFPMNSFASGTANTNQNKHSAANKITDSIKSGAKKVGDATKEHVIEPAKDAAKTIARNPGKSATVATVLVVYGLLSGLAGNKLGTLPELDTQGMTDEEKERVVETHKVLKELTENFYIEVNENEFSWNLSQLKDKYERIEKTKIKIGELAAELMPGSDSSNEATAAYTSARNKYIKYEKALSTTLEQQKQKIEKQMEEQVTKLTTDNEALKTKAKQKEEELKQKEDEIKNLNEENANQLTEKLEEQREKYENELNEQKEKHEEETKKLEEAIRQKEEELTKQEALHKNELEEKKKEWTEREEELLAVSAELQMIAHAQKTVNGKLKKEIEGNKNEKILIPFYTNLPEIYNTISTALGNTIRMKNRNTMDLHLLKQKVSSGDIQAYNAFRVISNHLRGGNKRLQLLESWTKSDNVFSLAEILLTPTAGFPTRLKDESNLEKVDIEYLNLDTEKYSTNGDLRKDAEETKTWLKWLQPYKGGLLRKSLGLANDSVVNQLPELIIAAATLKDSKTLISLLTALEHHLTVDTTSEYRENVNKALQKVGMCFDDNICKLVSTNPSKK